MKALIVYYTRTRTTAKLAKAIADELDATLEPITSASARYDSGLFGFIKAGMDSFTGAKEDIQPLQHQPMQFDLLAIGTPVWNNSMATPVKQFLKMYRGQFKDVAFFCTYGLTEGGKTFEEMSSISGKTPKATLAVHENEIKRGTFKDSLETYICELREGYLYR